MYMYVLLRGRVSAKSTTTRWSSRVGSTDRPEFRSYLFGKLRKSTGPFRTVKRQYFYHVGQGYLPIFKIHRCPRGDLPSLHTLDGTRTERATSVLEPCVTREDGHQSPVGPDVPLRRHNGLANFPTRSTLSQWRKGHERADTFHKWGYLLNNREMWGASKCKVIRILISTYVQQGT